MEAFLAILTLGAIKTTKLKNPCRGYKHAQIWSFTMDPGRKEIIINGIITRAHASAYPNAILTMARSFCEIALWYLDILIFVLRCCCCCCCCCCSLFCWQQRTTKDSYIVRIAFVTYHPPSSRGRFSGGQSTLLRREWVDARDPILRATVLPQALGASLSSSSSKSFLRVDDLRARLWRGCELDSTSASASASTSIRWIRFRFEWSSFNSCTLNRNEFAP